ncbi:MAG: ATP-binding protein [Candidatus Zixiibacteriota bacterium]
MMSIGARIVQRLPRLFNLGFFTRLSNIILIHGVFVFAAVAMIVFSPQQRGLTDSRVFPSDAKLRDLANKIRSGLDKQNIPIANVADNEQVQSLFFSLFLPQKKIVQAEIFVRKDSQGFASIFTFQRPWRSERGRPATRELSEAVDTRIINLAMDLPSGIFIPPVHSAKHSVYYYPFQIGQGWPAVLVTVSEHGLVISHRSRLLYALLVLFLCSILVSLLTVYLISNRFKGPLDRLIHGFEKTAGGELYYLIETKGDRELQKLTAAFNKMSQKLWENHQKLRQLNADLKKANLSLRESQQFLTTLIDRSPVCIVATSPEGEIMIFNRMASETFGYKPKEVVGINAAELFSCPLNAKRIPHPPDNQSGLEVLCRRRDKSIFPAYMVVSPVVNGKGSITAYLYIIRDISESKSFQEMMVRLNRYYTRGEMAGEIAHEINNYLTVLSGNMELMPFLLEKGDSDKILQRIDIMRQTVEKIAHFTEGLTDSSPDETKLEPTDLNQIVEDAVAFLKPQNKFDNIDIITTLSTEMPLVELDVSQIQQVLVNLLDNAAEALKDQPGQRRIWITTSVIPGSREKSARIEVKDNGSGVAEDKVSLLFLKRFTTKRRGHGIGLITCRRIVEAHNGKISYRKEDGAIFSFEIPIKRKYSQADGSSNQAAPTVVTPL